MSTESKPLKIVRLEASNIKRLKAVEIIPSGNTVIISGKNDNGKTSTLDAIEYALAGKDSICERPIRDGTSKAYVICDLGELIVKRTFSASGGTNLTVETKDGAAVKSPQALLDSLCAKIAFDPLAFVRSEPKAQLETLRKLVGLDFASLDAEKQKTYDERTLVNRESKNLEGKLAGFPHDASAPAEEVNVTELFQQLRAAQDKNRDNATARNDLSLASGRLDSLKVRLSDTDKLIAEMERKVAEAKELRRKQSDDVDFTSGAVEAQKKACDELQDVPLVPIQDKLSNADNINTKVRTNRRHMEIALEIKNAKKKSDALSDQIAKIDRDKESQLKAAKFPLPNLSFDESGVLLNGVPFSQGSQARQLQAAVAIGIALNPKVRVIIVRDASLLDSDSLAMMKTIADEKDAQIWLEVVSSDDKSAVVIEDGEVKDT